MGSDSDPPSRELAMEKLAQGINRLVEAVEGSVREARAARLLVLLTTLLVSVLVSGLTYFIVDSVSSMNQRIGAWDARLTEWDDRLAREEGSREREEAIAASLAAALQKSIEAQLAHDAEAAHAALVEAERLSLVTEATVAASEVQAKRETAAPAPAVEKLEEHLESVKRKAARRGVMLPSDL